MSRKLTPDERVARREKLAEKARKWRAEHPGYSALHKSAARKAKHAEYMRKWYIRHPGVNYGNVKQWRKENPEKWAAQSSAWSKKHRAENLEKYHAKDRRTTLRCKYGVTVEWFDEKLAAQGGGCGICGSTKTPKGKSFPVDHSHATGKTRGILCQHCNLLLYKLEEVPGWIEKAMLYLKQYE